MRKSYLNLLLLFFLFWTGCQEDDDNITASHYSQQLIGKWEFVEGVQIYWPNLKYLIVNPDNYYYFLSIDEDNRQSYNDGVYSVTGNQINLNSYGLFIYTITGDTLNLSNTDYSMTFVRNNSIPDADEWVLPVIIEKKISLPDSLFIDDITFDGTYFWASGGSIIIKMDTLGNPLLSYHITSNNGITYGNGYLWVAGLDSLKKINPENGQILWRKRLEQVSSLAYEPGYIWANQYSGRVIKIKDDTGEITDSIPLHLTLSDIEFHDAKLWNPDDTRIHSFDSETGNVVQNYQVPGSLSHITGLAFDGSAFWCVTSSYFTDQHFLEKLILP